MRSNLPVIFLAFANEYHEGRYLAKLVEEYKELYATLGPVSANENPPESDRVVCELVVRQNATIGDIIDVFQNPLYQGRIAVFHYGGHADGYQLLLQGKDGESEAAKGVGLVPLLSRRKSLRLVFLNGCSTQQLARDLVERGVPAVIGTASSIADDIALMLSTRFYKGLARGLTMGGAWEEAKDEVKAVRDPEKDYRSIRLDKGERGRFPWDVEFRDDASKEVFNKWNLPDEANQPLFNLPAPQKTQLPPSPFLFLKPYNAEQAEIFFGRSFYIRDLYLKILETSSPPIILLYGESGAGKSSLLDAGLRPRLEAATAEEDPDARLFEVRYRRRDQDLGLVGTLAEMLSYFSLAVEPDTPEEKETEAPDPNLEKIRQIETLAMDLEEDTAGTFLSFIERYKAIRAYRGGAEQRQQLYRTGELSEHAGAQLRDAWISIEKKSGRRLVIILDQVEELFTRPNQAMEKELEDFLGVLQDIFNAPTESGEVPIRGKIVLGYREEFNAKIEARVKDYALPRSTVFLEQLKRKDILDIFKGLTSGVVADYYNIRVDDRLPERVTNDLLKGKESAAPGQSPVAPVLQLLLTKLWNKTYQENSHQPDFSLEAYDDIQSQGKEMEEYFETQMKKVEALNAEAVRSGLALDLLQFHVSDLGTSRRCHLDDIRHRYRHLPEEYGDQPDIVDKLVNWLKSPEIFLLNDNGRGYTSLPHDTLAPIIMREYNRSDKLGQRSARILDTKRPDFIRALQDDAVKKVRLDDNDLEVVEGGIKGMRALDAREKELLRISMEEREKRMRLRRILVQGGIVAGLFILVLTVFAGSLSISMNEQLGNAAVSRAHEQSLIEQDQAKSSPVKAIQLAQFAYGKSDIRRLDVVHNLYGLYQKNQTLDYEDYFFEEDYYTDLEEDSLGYFADTYEEVLPDPETLTDNRPLSMTLRPAARISSLDYQPSLGPLVSLENRTVKYWPKGDLDNEVTINLGSELGIGDIKEVEVGFSGDGQKIQVLSRFNRRRFYLMDGELTVAPTLDIFSPFHTGYGEEAELPLGYYDFFSGKFVDEFGLSYSLEEFRQYAEDNFLYGTEGWYSVKNAAGEEITVDSLFSINLLDETHNRFRQRAFTILERAGWGVNLEGFPAGISEEKKEISLRPTNLVRGSFNVLFAWSPDSLSGQPEGVFVEEGDLNYLAALTGNSVLTVGADGETTIWTMDGFYLAGLLPPGSGLTDLTISPDHRHIIGMTADSVLIWGLDGNRITAYYHPDIRQYTFSTDGARLFTLSSDRVWVWSAEGNGLLAYPRPPEAPPIVLARFNDAGDHLVIGLTETEGPPVKNGFFSFLKRKKKAEGRIVYWSIAQGQEVETFRVTGGELTGATVSEDGRFAVALQPGRATVIPTSKEKIRSREYHSEPIEAVASGKRENLKLSKVFLSPGGRYILRQSPHERRIELFGRDGRPVNSYSFQGGFRQGFDGRIFTPDDHYLIGSKSNEVLFWHPEDQDVREWADGFELTFGEKQDLGLDNFIDYIPGTKTDTRWWAVGLILLSLVFILLYFSDFIIQFIQQKTYLEIAVYGAGFVLLSLLFIGVWAVGLSPDFWPEEWIAEGLKKTALYGVFWATLAALLLGCFRAWRLQKLPLLAVMTVVALFLAYGAVHFFVKESRYHSEAFDKAYLQTVRTDYRERPAFYDSLYQVSVAAVVPAGNASQRLTSAQLKEVAKRNQLDLYQPGRTREWPPLLFGLVLLLLFAALGGYPLYRSLQAYRREDHSMFYRWLLAPTAFLMLLFWFSFGMFWESNQGDDTLGILRVFSIIALLVIGLTRLRAYWKERKTGAIITYGIPVLLITTSLLMANGLFALALAATFITGRQYRREEASARSFLAYTASLFLLGGVLVWTLFMWQWALLGGLGLSALLVLIFYGMRWALQKMAGHTGSAGKKWLYRFSIAGLWFLGVFFSLAFAGEMLQLSEFQDAYYEDPYYYETYEETEADYLEEAYTDEGYDEEAELLREDEAGPDTSYEDSEEEPVPENDFLSETPADETDPEESAPAGEVDFSAPVLNNRQRHIVGLFDPDESVRDEARLQLSAYWKGDGALIPELIQYSYENPALNEGIWNSIYLLGIQSDELLRSHRNLLEEYLEWVSQKGYGQGTMERIQELQVRISN